MSFLKSFGDGVGTAAGVAWPTFGIAFGTIGLTVGASATAITLSIISGGLFGLVLLPITYWSYKQNRKEHEKRNQKIQKQETILTEMLLTYLLTLLRKCLFEQKLKHTNNIRDLVRNIKTKIKDDINENLPIQIQLYLKCFLSNSQSENFLRNFVHAINNDQSIIKDDFTPVINSPHTKKFIQENINKVIKKSDNFVAAPVSSSAKMKTGIIGFASGFGAIAGCSAGTLGLLTSVGICAGLAAVPIIGWGILAAAAIFGIITAAISRSSLNSKDKKDQLIRHHKKTNHKLEGIVNKQTC